MSARTFTRDQLASIGVPYEVDAFKGAAVELADEHVSEGRWLETRRMVFRAPDDGKAYAVEYDRGLTENQWCSPFEHRGDTVEAVEVEQRTRTVEITEWHPAVDEAGR
jgi:hypothetical protein